MVPLALRVRPATDAARSRWAAERGYRDSPGTVIMEVALSDVEVNGKLPHRSFPSVPHDARTRDAGFVTEAMPPAAAARPVTPFVTGDGH